MKICVFCQHQFDSRDWRCPNCGQTPQLHRGFVAFAPEMIDETDGYKAEYFAPLAEVEKGNFWFEGRNRHIIWAVKRYFPTAGHILEIGCGTGFVLMAIYQAFPDAGIFGAELFPEGLEFAAGRVPSATFFQMDARAMPFDQEFDVIGAFDVIEHIVEDEQVLAQMCKAVKPGGGIVLTVPQHRFLWSAADHYKHHQRRYERRELINKVQQAGFEFVYATSFVSFLLPVMLLSRLRQNAANTRDRMTEFQINDALNGVFDRVMRMEGLLVQQQVSLPVGGSLLLVARRPITAHR